MLGKVSRAGDLIFQSFAKFIIILQPANHGCYNIYFQSTPLCGPLHSFLYYLAVLSPTLVAVDDSLPYPYSILLSFRFYSQQDLPTIELPSSTVELPSSTALTGALSR